MGTSALSPSWTEVWAPRDPILATGVWGGSPAGLSPHPVGSALPLGGWCQRCLVGEPTCLVSELLCTEEWFSFNALPGGGRPAEAALAPASGHCVCPTSNPPHCHRLMAGLVGEKTWGRVGSILRWWVTGWGW